MKIRGFVYAIPVLLFAPLACAQDDSLTPEQREAIQKIAMKINESCQVPAGPEIPDGKTATRDDMVSSQKALQAYIEDGNSYLGCLDGVEKSWGEDITANQKAVVDALYNRAVTALQSSADAFNDQLHIYQDKSTN